MIITFCGHSNFIATNKLEDKLLSILNEYVGNDQADFYFGEYGAFDEFAFKCASKYKSTHPQVKLIFVTPYITEEYIRNRLQNKKYDTILYPEIENIPPKFAIVHRNRYMIKKSDIVIAYITHAWGGAYQTYKYAKGKNKNIINISATD